VSVVTVDELRWTDVPPALLTNIGDHYYLLTTCKRLHILSSLVRRYAGTMCQHYDESGSTRHVGVTEAVGQKLWDDRCRSGNNAISVAGFATPICSPATRGLVRDCGRGFI
jgi:hypothetical protein